MADGWAVAFTHPREEDRVVWHAGLLGFSSYCPKIRYKQRLGGGRFRFRYEPLFPRYVFIRISDQWYALLSLLGVNRLIMNAERPALLTENFVRELQSNSDKDGFYVPKRFVPGQAVRIKRRSFLQDAIYEGQHSHDRVAVLMKLLGRDVRVIVKEADVEAVA